MSPGQIAEQAIGLFIEYRDVHGYDEARARVAAVAEVDEGIQWASYALLPESDEEREGGGSS